MVIPLPFHFRKVQKVILKFLVGFQFNINHLGVDNFIFDFRTSNTEDDCDTQEITDTISTQVLDIPEKKKDPSDSIEEISEKEQSESIKEDESALDSSVEGKDNESDTPVSKKEEEIKEQNDDKNDEKEKEDEKEKDEESENVSMSENDSTNNELKSDAPSFSGTPPDPMKDEESKNTTPVSTPPSTPPLSGSKRPRVC